MKAVALQPRQSGKVIRSDMPGAPEILIERLGPCAYGYRWFDSPEVLGTANSYGRAYNYASKGVFQRPDLLSYQPKEAAHG